VYHNHPQYPQLHIGAHRKPAAVVGAPALICHLGFWTGKVYRDERDQKPIPEVNKSDIDNYLYQLYRNLAYPSSCIHNVSDFVTYNADEPANPKYVVLFERSINHATRQLEADRRDVIRANSYQVISYQFKWYKMRVTLRFEMHTEYFTISIFIDGSPKPDAGDSDVTEISRRVSDNLGALFELQAKNERDPKACSEVHAFLYHNIWKTFFCEVLEVPNFDLRSLGYIFVDFRGLIVGTPDDPARDAQPFQLPFYRTPTNDDLPPQRQPRTSDSWSSRLHAFWPFLTSEIRVEFNKYEFTASQMLQGHALYVTALGAQPSQYLQDHDRFPLLYFAYVDARSTWQIGRFVDRIHHLGTVRIAAIMEVDRLRASGLALRNVEHDIDEAFILAQRDADDKAATETLFQRISNIQNELSQINACFDGGLEYRVERSRYYVKQFRDGVQALRILRLEGFQQYFLTRNSNDMARDSNAIAAAIAARNEAIEGLQTTAEIMLFGALAPYYVGMIAHHLLGLFGYSEDDPWPYEWFIWLLVSATGAGAALHRFRTRYNAKYLQISRFVRRWSLPTVFVVGSGLLGWYAAHHWADWLTYLTNRLSASGPATHQ